MPRRKSQRTLDYERLKLVAEEGKSPLCVCGCGSRVMPNIHTGGWNSYITGHNRRGKEWTEAQREKIPASRRGKCNHYSSLKTKVERRIKISRTMRGRERSEEHKKNLSIALKRKYKEDEEFRRRHLEGAKRAGEKLRGRVAWNKGQTKETNESVRKVSEGLKERFRDKTQHPSWQGGLSFEPYSTDFDRKLKMRIQERDGWKCSLCGRKQEDGMYFQVHHIDYDKKNSSVNNLILLCNSCHAKTNYQRGFWQGFLFGLVVRRFNCNLT